MSAHGVETEIKLPFEHPDKALASLQALGFAISSPRIFEANIVYDTQAQVLRKSGHLLRLRTVGSAGVLTWKGASVAAVHKTRPEFETGVADPVSCELILQNLGYSPVFRYEKYRTELQQPSCDGIATVDETPIGCFVELEGSPEWIDLTAEKLGFRESDYITVSYGTLYRDSCESAGIPVEWMVFSKA